MNVLQKSGILVCLVSLSLAAGAQSADHWETIISAGDTWKYIIPASEPDTNWRYPVFDDSGWNDGAGGLGYADGDDKTILESGTQSVFLRKKFNVTDTSKIESLLLNADYDDAFVAYINGVEIARGGGLVARYPAYNSLASFTREAIMYSGANPESFLVKRANWKKFLTHGENVLSVQVHNDTKTSSDLSAIMFLSAGIRDGSILYSATPTWFEAPVESGVSNLPLVLINTNGAYIRDEPKTAAQLSIIDNGTGNINSITDNPVLTCRIGIETRGSSSQQFPKKSYGFETRTELDSNLNVSLLGLPADNDWVLYAPYDDKTFLRDVLAYRLGSQMGHYAPRFVFCELYLNNSYQGVYVLIEKIKQGANRVNIANLKPTDIAGKDVSGGYIFKIDKATGSSNDGWTSPHHPKQLADRYIEFLYHYPEPDKITIEQKQYIKYFVTQFENSLASATFTDEQTGYRKFIDLESFVDYFIMNEISKNVDGYRISSYFHKDKEDRSNKIVAGPLWDYNLGFGNADYYNGYTHSDWVINSIPNSDNWQVPFWWKRFLDDPYFYSVLRTRYTGFRKNILKEENINGYIDSMVVVLQDAQKRNYQKWPILGVYTWPNPFVGATYQQEIDYMKDWIDKRLQWIDGKLLILSTQIPSQVSNETAVVYPNPFDEHLFIEIFPDNASDYCTIEIFDITGKLLFSDKTEISRDDKTLYTFQDNAGSLSMLKPGIYLIKIRLEYGRELKGKIIKK